MVLGISGSARDIGLTRRRFDLSLDGIIVIRETSEKSASVCLLAQLQNQHICPASAVALLPPETKLSFKADRRGIERRILQFALYDESKFLC